MPGWAELGWCRSTCQTCRGQLAAPSPLTGVRVRRQTVSTFVILVLESIIDGSLPLECTQCVADCLAFCVDSVRQQKTYGQRTMGHRDDAAMGRWVTQLHKAIRSDCLLAWRGWRGRAAVAVAPWRLNDTAGSQCKQEQKLHHHLHHHHHQQQQQQELSTGLHVCMRVGRKSVGQLARSSKVNVI